MLLGITQKYSRAHTEVHAATLYRHMILISYKGYFMSGHTLSHAILQNTSPLEVMLIGKNISKIRHHTTVYKTAGETVPCHKADY